VTDAVLTTSVAADDMTDDMTDDTTDDMTHDMTDDMAEGSTPVIVWIAETTSGLGARLAHAVMQHRGLRIGNADDCDVAVLLPASDGDIDDQRRRRITDRVADALQALPQARHVVLVSSAMVYGAWANNPIPITEDAVLRPDVQFDYARQLVAAEESVDRWRRAAPGRTASIMRPVVAMAADGTSGLASALAAGMGQQLAQDDPPAQFLHLDDLTSAVLLACGRQLDGVFNVAPDGWVRGERVRALTGAVLRVKLPDRLDEVITNLRWRFQRGPIPPGLRSYTRWPWMVANDRLKAEGWTPTVTNEQAYVEGTEAKWWTLVSPQRRQEISLGGLVAVLLLGGWVAARLVLRARSRRSLTDLVADAQLMERLRRAPR
jgi:nucleoside-diphosphate-sugar epimerase